MLRRRPRRGMPHRRQRRPALPTRLLDRAVAVRLAVRRLTPPAMAPRILRQVLNAKFHRHPRPRPPRAPNHGRSRRASRETRHETPREMPRETPRARSLCRRPLFSIRPLSVLVQTALIGTTAPSTGRPTRHRAALSVTTRESIVRSRNGLSALTVLIVPNAAGVRANADGTAMNVAIADRASSVVTRSAARRLAEPALRRTVPTAARIGDPTVVAIVVTGMGRIGAATRLSDVMDVADVAVSVVVEPLATLVRRKVRTAVSSGRRRCPPPRR